MQLSAVEVVLLGGLAVVELALLVAAWVVLFRTPSARLTLPKWAWALICLVQFVGPIAFFAAGRRPRPLDDTPQQASGDVAGRVIDDLYGDR